MLLDGYDGPHRAQAELIQQVAHEDAFRIAAIALQDGGEALDVAVDAMFSTLFDPIDERVLFLAMLVRRLADGMALLAKTSTHPYAASLATHRDLLELQGQGIAEMIERLLRDGVL